MKKILIIILMIFLAGCASGKGFNINSLKNLLSDNKIPTEEDIKKALELEPQLPKPFKLAVFFSYPKSSPWINKKWIWLSGDKEIFRETEKELKQNGIISEMLMLNDSILEGADRKSVRLAAARAGADAVLIINGISDIDRYNNVFAVSYFLLVTMFFVPGSVTESIFVANASLWDVRNQYLYLFAEAEATAKKTRPAFFTGEKGVINKARSAAIGKLKDDIIVKITQLNNQ